MPILHSVPMMREVHVVMMRMFASFGLFLDVTAKQRSHAPAGADPGGNGPANVSNLATQ